MFGLQAQRHDEECRRSQLELRKNGCVGNKNSGDPAGSGKQNAIRRHEKKMTKFSRERSGEIQVKKVALTENGLEVASQKIENGHIAEQMPWPVMEKHGSDELPRVCIVHTAFAHGQIIADETRLVDVEKKLCDKNREVEGD